MAAISWKSGVNGDWNTGADWSNGAIPGASDAVTIAASGAYTVTIDQNEAAQSVALKAAGATVAMSGKDVVLTIGTSFSVTAGTLSLTGNSTIIDQPRITGGTISTGAAGILLVNAVAGDTSDDEFDVNSAVSLAGTTTIATGAFLALGGGGSLGGTIGGGGQIGLGDLAYTAKAATFAASLGELTVEDNGSLALSSTSGTIAAFILLANTGTIAIASGTAITSSNYLEVGVGPLLDYQYNNVLSGPGTLVTTGAAEVLDAGTGTDMLLLGGGINWTNSGKITDYGQIAMNTVSADKVTITNAATGTFILEGGDANLLTHGAFTNGKDSFVNAGLLQRLPNPDDGSGAGTISFAASINSTGTIDVESGTLAFTDGGTLAGTLSGAGTLLLYSGTYAIGALAGSGHLSVGTGATVTYSTSTISTAYVLDNSETLAVAAGKTLVISGPFTIGDSTGGGTLAGPGTLSTTGSTTIADLGGPIPLDLEGKAVWINSGSVTDFGAVLYNQSGAGGDSETILNKGTFTLSGVDSQITPSGGGTDSFTNTGILSRTGTGTSLLYGKLNSSGTINVASGTLQCEQGGGALSGTLSGAGTLVVADAGYTTTGLSGTGTLAINIGYNVYGTLTATTTSTITDSVQLYNLATLAVLPGKDLTLSGEVDTYGGTFSGAGPASASATITTSGTTTVTDQNTALTILNDVTWVNAGSVLDNGIIAENAYGTDGGTETILNSGSFTFAGPDSEILLSANGNNIFSNTGTLVRSGVGGTTLEGTLNSTGLINIASGTLLGVHGGGAVSGTLSGAGTLALGDIGYTTTGIAGTGTLALTNSGFGVGTLTATATGTITGSVLIDGGAKLAAAAGKILTISGPLTIGASTVATNGGTFTGPGTITTTGVTTIADLGTTQVLSLQGGANWINTGSVTESGAGNYNTAGVDGDTDSILNKGSFTFAGPDAGFGLSANGTDIFTNTGTLARTGAGTSILDGTVNSSGTINVAGGVLQVQRGGGALSGTLSGAGTLALGDIGYTTTGLSGSGTLALNNNYQIGTLTASATGTITDSLQIDGGATLAAAAGTTLTVSGPVKIGSSTIYTNGGVLSGPGTITTTGATTLADLGTTQVLSLQGGATWINTGSVTQSGVANYNTPGVDGDTDTILNKGSFTLAGPDAGFGLAANGTDIFTNTGTLTRSGTGTSILDGTVNSSKIINVTGGVLQLQRGGGALSGTLSGAGTLALGDVGYTTTGIAGTGTLALNNNYQIGTLTASATGTITDSLQIDGGATLAAAAGTTLTLSGPVKIGSSTIYTNGGVLSGPGTITTTGATTLADLGTTQVLSLQGGATWINTGSVTQSGVANYNTPGVDGDTDTILNKGSFTLAGPDAGFGLAANGTDIFTNTGTLTRSGTGTSILDGTVNSSKIINVTGGVLQLQRGGGALSGTLSGAGTLALGDIGYTTTGLSGTGTLALNNNYQIGTLTATATGTITDSLQIDGGATLAAAAGTTLTVSGPVKIGSSTIYTNGGVLSGPGTVTTAGATTIADLGTTQVLGLQGGITWINTGSVTESGAGSYNTPGIDGDKVAVLNKGVFILSGLDANFALAANGTDSFTNSGTLRRAGAGTSTIDSRIAISNTGTIDAAAGTLALAGGVTGTGVITIDAGAALYIGATPSSQSITFTGGAGATLGLDAPVSRSLTGFTGGDRLDLVGTGVTSASISGTTLTVVTGSGTLQFISAGLAGEVAATSADAGGGTYVSIYRPAAATHTPEPLAFGNYHVGATVGTKLALTVANTDPADGYSEKLNAGLGAASAGFTASGTVTGIAAGASNSTSLTATIDTSTAGAKTGTATLTLATVGTGIDGRGTTALASQTVNLSGAVYAYAAASLASSSITLANHHVGDTPSAFLTLSNTAATGAYSEGLDAKFTAASGAATGTGSVSLLTAGASNSTSLGIGLAAAAGGVATGTETLTFISDGQGTSGLGTTTLGTQAVSVTGTFYALATGTLASGTVAFGNHHVGDTIAAKLIKLTNGAPTGGFSEALDASLTAMGAISATGSISRLAAGASNSTSLSVGEVASAAGTIGGSLVLNLVSDGTAIDGLGTTTLLGQTITVTGANYALASGTLASSTINLGVIHASTAASAVLSLTNGAPTGGYGESLDAGLSLASAGLSTHGTISRLAAGVKDTTSLSLSVNTATTGQYSGSATLGLISDGTGTSGLGTTTLTSQTVTVTATIDNYAAAAFEDPSGPAITGSSTNATINLGSTLQGNAALTLSLGAINAASGLSDLLAGTISTAGAAGFTNSGFGAIGGLSAGQDEHAQSISLATSTAGTFSETVTLSTYGTNASGYDGALTPETLTVTGTITPSIFHTYTLGLGPNTINGADGLGDIFVASAGALNTRDQLTGGSGANSLTLAGAGLFDVNAPSVFTNIPTIVASEGQAAMGSAADTRQTVMLRDNAVETLKVGAGISASGNNNPEAITIYAFGGTDTIALAAGTDQVLLGTGNATVTLGGVSNSVTAGGGTALVHSTGALAGAAVIGAATGSTTLDITTGGAITLNAADSYLTVRLHAASNLTLSSLSFITAIGSSGADTLTALATSQSLTGGAGADILNGYSGGGDSFADTAAGLNGDTINSWTTGDVIDITNIAAANLHPLTFASNTLTATDGTTTTAIKFAAGEALGNFNVLGADGAGTGVLIGFHA